MSLSQFGSSHSAPNDSEKADVRQSDTSSPLQSGMSERPAKRGIAFVDLVSHQRAWMMGEQRVVHIEYGRADVFVMNELVADASRFDARAGDDQRDADDSVVVSGGFSALISAHFPFRHQHPVLRRRNGWGDIFAGANQIEPLLLPVFR